MRQKIQNKTGNIETKTPKQDIFTLNDDNKENEQEKRIVFL